MVIWFVVIWADIVQSVIPGSAVGMSFSMSASPEAMQNTFFLIYVVGRV